MFDNAGKRKKMIHFQKKKTPTADQDICAVDKNKEILSSAFFNDFCKSIDSIKDIANLDAFDFSKYLSLAHCKFFFYPLLIDPLKEKDNMASKSP